MENIELNHSGVKGMKWGVRRYQNKDGSLTPAGKKRYASEMNKLRSDKKVVKTASATKAKLDKLNTERKAVDEQKKALFGRSKKSGDTAETTPRKVMKKKKASEMTDAELKAVISRMEMEKNYKDLMVEMDRNTRRTQKAKEVVENALIKSGENLLSQVFNQVGVKALNKAFDSIGLGDKDDKGEPTPAFFTNNKRK